MPRLSRGRQGSWDRGAPRGTPPPQPLHARSERTHLEEAVQHLPSRRLARLRLGRGHGKHRPAWPRGPRPGALLLAAQGRAGAARGRPTQCQQRHGQLLEVPVGAKNCRSPLTQRKHNRAILKDELRCRFTKGEPLLSGREIFFFAAKSSGWIAFILGTLARDQGHQAGSCLHSSVQSLRMYHAVRCNIPSIP